MVTNFCSKKSLLRRHFSTLLVIRCFSSTTRFPYCFVVNQCQNSVLASKTAIKSGIYNLIMQNNAGQYYTMSCKFTIILSIRLTFLNSVNLSQELRHRFLEDGVHSVVCETDSVSPAQRGYYWTIQYFFNPLCWVFFHPVLSRSPTPRNTSSMLFTFISEQCFYFFSCNIFRTPKIRSLAM